ncbi:hypothetical protein ACVINI_006476 [Rhizobium beringeri]
MTLDTRFLAKARLWPRMDATFEVMALVNL